MNSEKRILIAANFVGDKRILHGKEAYFKRLIDYMSKRYGVLFDVKDFSGREVTYSVFKRATLGVVQYNLSLPAGCTHSCWHEHIGLYYGLPSFRSVFFKNDRDLCLSLAKRQLLHSTIKPFPAVRSKLRHIKFFVSATTALKRLTYELMRLSPSLIICFNRETPFNTLLRVVAEKNNIPILFMEGGILPGTIEIDSVGNEALSWPVRCSEKFNKLVINEEDRSRATRFLSFLRQNKISRKAQSSSELGSIIDKENNDRPVLFFAGSNERGAGIYYEENKTVRDYSPFFSGNLEALNSLVTLAEKHDWTVIFKPHPNETDYGADYDLSSPKVHIVKHASVFDIIDSSDVTVTITSGVSGISLIHGKPSILLGKNGLSGKGATYELDSKENLELLTVKAIKEGFTPEMQKMWMEYSARIIKYYSLSFGDDIEAHIGRGVENAAQLLMDYLKEEKRKQLFI